MKFGANAFLWADRFGPEQFALLPRLKEAGFDGLEIPLIELAEIDTARCRRAFESSSLECTACAVLPPGLNTISDDAGIRDRTAEHWKKCIRMSAEVGSRILAGPLYAPVGYLPGRRRTEEEWKRAVALFQELTPVLEDNDVTLAIEPLNRYETYFLNTASDAAKLCGEIGHPQIGLLFDTYHANIEEKSIGDAIQTVAPFLRHFHSCENDRGIPGTGHVEWAEVFKALRSVNYDGWLTIEGFSFSAGVISTAASIWRDLAPTPEAIAFEGVSFLKHELANAQAAIG